MPFLCFWSNCHAINPCKEWSHHKPTTSFPEGVKLESNTKPQRGGAGGFQDFTESQYLKYPPLSSIEAKLTKTTESSLEPINIEKLRSCWYWNLANLYLAVSLEKHHPLSTLLLYCTDLNAINPEPCASLRDWLHFPTIYWSEVKWLH